MNKKSPILKLEKALIAGYDIGIPYNAGDSWLILNPDDDEVAEGMSLEDAIKNLEEEFCD